MTERKRERERDEVARVTHPVHDEDLVDVESLLQQFGGNGHGVEVAEAPGMATERKKLSRHAVPKHFHVFIAHFKTYEK